MNRPDSKFSPNSSSWQNRFRCCLAACAVVSAAHAAEVDLLPTTPPPTDGQFTQVTLAGEPVWQNTGTASFLYFKRPTSFAFTAGQTLYLRVTYFDDIGGGRLDMRYDSQTAALTNPLVHTRTSRVASGRFVDGFFELTNVRFTGRVSGSDFRLICGKPGDVPIVGDFNGDGIDEIGVVRGDTWIIDTDGDRRLTGNDLHIKIPRPTSESQPVVGDWDGDGVDQPGYYDDAA